MQDGPGHAHGTRARAARIGRRMPPGMATTGARRLGRRRRGHGADLQPHQAHPDRVHGPHHARRGAPRTPRRRRPSPPARDPRAVAAGARGRALARPASGALRRRAPPHQRDPDRVGVAARAGPARRVARRVSSTASKPRCSPSRPRHRGSSTRCAVARSIPARWVRRRIRADTCERVRAGGKAAPRSSNSRRGLHRAGASSRAPAARLARRPRARPRAGRAACAAAARVRGRSPQPHRVARPRSSTSRASCSRPATAPSRSTRSPPTRSATS